METKVLVPVTGTRACRSCNLRNTQVNAINRIEERQTVNSESSNDRGGKSSPPKILYKTNYILCYSNFFLSNVRPAAVIRYVSVLISSGSMTDGAFSMRPKEMSLCKILSLQAWIRFEWPFAILSRQFRSTSLRFIACRPLLTGM